MKVALRETYRVDIIYMARTSVQHSQSFITRVVLILLMCIACRVTKASRFEILCLTSPIPGIDSDLKIGFRGCVNGTSGSDCIRLSGRGVQKSKLSDAVLEAAAGLQEKAQVDLGRERQLSELNLAPLTGGISRKFDRGFVPNKIRYFTDNSGASDSATFTVDESSGGLTAVFLKDEFYLRYVHVRMFLCAVVFLRLPV